MSQDVRFPDPTRISAVGVPVLLSALSGRGLGAGEILVLAVKQDSGREVRSISPRRS